MTHGTQATDEKQPYSPPVLAQYGRVADLTDSKTGADADGKSGLKKARG